MDNISEILQTTYIGAFVATFLFNTGSIIKAVDIFNECLVLLNGKARETIKELTTPLLIYVYSKLLDGYTLVYDHTRAIECGKKLLLTLHNSGKKEVEGMTLIKLANIYYQRSKYEKAKQFYEKALSFMIEAGNNRGVGTCYGNLGIVFQSVGQYTKAEEYLQKALVIKQEIGDKAGVGASYLNLAKLCAEFQLTAKSQEFANKAREISYEIGDIEMQFNSHLTIALNELVAGGSITKLLRNLYESIQKCEETVSYTHLTLPTIYSV